MRKMAGSGSISQRHGSADLDPDSYQNQVILNAYYQDLNARDIPYHVKYLTE
jgi:hypothetical protein